MAGKGKGQGAFGYGGGFTTIGSRLFDLWMLGVLWLLCSIPLLTIGASTTALYYAVVHSVKNDDGYASHMFFRSFRRNFRQATILWLVLAACFMLMRLNTGILMAKTEGTAGLVMIGFYTAVMVYLVLMGCYLFPALSRFDMDTFWFLRLSIYMGVRYVFTSLMLLVVLAGAGALLWRFPVLIFFLPGPVVWLMAEFLESVLDKHGPPTGTSPGGEALTPRGAAAGFPDRSPEPEEENGKQS